MQNIAEGSQAAGTSKKTELKPTNVARASLEELRLDYEDFLRQRGLPIWDRQDPRREGLIARPCPSADCVARWVQEQRGLSGLGGPSGRGGPSKPNKTNSGPKGSQSPSPPSTQSTSSTKSTSSTFPEIAANAALVLIAVACSLLDRQLASLATALEREGGFTERLYRVRARARGQ